MQLGVVALWRSRTDQMTKTQEAHGVLLKKHYEIPFLKEYAMGFPVSYVIMNATGCIAKQVTTYKLHNVTRNDIRVLIK